MVTRLGTKGAGVGRGVGLASGSAGVGEGVGATRDTSGVDAGSAVGAVAATGLATLAGAGLLVTVLVKGPWTALLHGRGAAIAIACVVAALLGVVVRGTVLPEGFIGERSLLFRWHYMISSSAILGEQPFVGVGPDGYQPAYVRHRVPRNPEEVASAHSMFWDWLCALGLLGAAWIALVSG